MNKEEIMNRLTNVFRSVFDDEEINISDKTTADDIDDWDSLEHINLLVAVEQEFNIKFNMNDVGNMKNVGDMVNIIISRM